VLVALENNLLSFDGAEVVLTARLANCAVVLAEAMPRPVTHGVLISRIWGFTEPDNSYRDLKIAVCQLRKKLPPGLIISTIRHVGYRMEIARQESDAA